ncbi:MAG: hypothetical protein ACTHMT_06935 [Verrucomicrobiota bacterium]
MRRTPSRNQSASFNPKRTPPPNLLVELEGGAEIGFSNIGNRHPTPTFNKWHPTIVQNEVIGENWKNSN